MINNKQIKKISTEIAENFHPEKIILFGSYADGTYNADSDLDLLVIMNHKEKSVKKSVDIRLKIRPDFPVDLLVKTPKNINSRLEMGDPFLKNIIQNGITLYESNNKRMD